MDLDTVAEELYALPPEEFTAARDAAVQRAEDVELKRAIKALRRPTASAHAVNVLVRGQPDAVASLLTLGDELRAAMSGRGGDVRDLSERRRNLISTLIEADLPAAVRDDVTATFEAATADPRLGAAVQSGRLVKPLRYAGFGELPDLADVVATPLPRRAAAKKMPTAKKQPAAEKNALAKQPAPPTADLTAMRQRVLDLAGTADDAQCRYDAAARAVAEARQVLDRAERERSEAHKAARAAHAEVERARRELGRLERR